MSFIWGSLAIVEGFNMFQHRRQARKHALDRFDYTLASMAQLLQAPQIWRNFGKHLKFLRGMGPLLNIIFG